MPDPEVVEKRTTITAQPAQAAQAAQAAQPGQTGQTTNVNVRPDGGADVQVNDGTPNIGAVVEETTTTHRTI